LEKNAVILVIVGGYVGKDVGVGGGEVETVLVVG